MRERLVAAPLQLAREQRRNPLELVGCDGDAHAMSIAHVSRVPTAQTRQIRFADARASTRNPAAAPLPPPPSLGARVVRAPRPCARGDRCGGSHARSRALRSRGSLGNALAPLPALRQLAAAPPAARAVAAAAAVPGG